jgi:hypothetical protein
MPLPKTSPIASLAATRAAPSEAAASPEPSLLRSVAIAQHAATAMIAVAATAARTAAAESPASGS